MKKILSVVIAVMMLVLTTVPAMAVVSPEATYKYVVEVIPTEGGDGTYEFTTDIDEEGNQHVHIRPLPNPGYKFDHWVVDGPYTTDDKYTSEEMDLIITGDITVTPYYVKDGTVATGTVSKDDSPTSPQTGTNDVIPYAVMILSVLACGTAVLMLVKTSKSK